MYLQAPTSEKHYFIYENEFGIQYEGWVTVITCALCGGKSAA